MKQYKFFYHFNRNKKAMSVHFRGVCYSAKDVICLVPARTKWRASQPYLVMEGYANELQFPLDYSTITIQ